MSELQLAALRQLILNIKNEWPALRAIEFHVDDKKILIEIQKTQ